MEGRLAGPGSGPGAVRHLRRRHLPDECRHPRCVASRAAPRLHQGRLPQPAARRRARLALQRRDPQPALLRRQGRRGRRAPAADPRLAGHQHRLVLADVQPLFRHLRRRGRRRPCPMGRLGRPDDPLPFPRLPGIARRRRLRRLHLGHEVPGPHRQQGLCPRPRPRAALPLRHPQDTGGQAGGHHHRAAQAHPGRPYRLRRAGTLRGLDELRRPLHPGLLRLDRPLRPAGDRPPRAPRPHHGERPGEGRDRRGLLRGDPYRQLLHRQVEVEHGA